MESDGILYMHQQTFTTHNIYYNPVIGDGDNSAFTIVDKVQPYNATVLIQKSECVNYVTKHMGSNFEKSCPSI